MNTSGNNKENTFMGTMDTIDMINMSIAVRNGFPRTKDNYISSGQLDIRGILDDQETINKATEKYNILRELVSDLGQRILQCTQEHNAMKKEAANTIRSSGIGELLVEEQQAADIKYIPIIDYLTFTDIMPINVPVAEGMSLSAIPVNDKNSIRADGNLYYIKGINKFGFRLNGHLFIGNIGEVYTQERVPQKIKTCIHGANCRNINNCTYYHPGTKDIRNYISSSFSYQRFDKRISSQMGRKVGNRSTLLHDVERASKQDLELFYDQSVHDILCNLVIEEKSV